MSWDVLLIRTKTNREAMDLNARLIDCSTGEFIRPDEPTSFERWRAYRDQILGRNEM